jgi:hypothetical protein
MENGFKRHYSLIANGQRDVLALRSEDRWT